MRSFSPWRLLVASLLFPAVALADERTSLQMRVDETIAPLMAEHDIPGMAVALSIDGQRHVFNYGLAERETGIAVTDDTLFELGSLSKLYTATLAAYAEARGAVSLDAPASDYLDALKGSAFDDVSLLELATYTAGGLPLQFPDEVADDDAALLEYFRQWRPEYPPGTHRLYSNPSIGLLGYLSAERLGQPFEDAVAEHVFAPLGLQQSFYDVPENEAGHYAYGYSADDTPVRVNPGVLDAQAYGVKSSAGDMLTFVEAHMNATAFEPALQQALATTRTGFFTLGKMTQGLGWERYALPVSLETLEAGNALEVILQANEVEPAQPRLSPDEAAWFNKTGATNGFGNYVAFDSDKRIAVVLLANRNYPNQARIEAAYQVLEAIDSAR